MIMENKFSTKNKYLYKMKCLNTRLQEYYEDINIEEHRTEYKNNQKNKKGKQK